MTEEPDIPSSAGNRLNPENASNISSSDKSSEVLFNEAVILLNDTRSKLDSQILKFSSQYNEPTVSIAELRDWMEEAINDSGHSSDKRMMELNQLWKDVVLKNAPDVCTELWLTEALDKVMQGMIKAFETSMPEGTQLPLIDVVTLSCVSKNIAKRFSGFWIDISELKRIVTESIIKMHNTIYGLDPSSPNAMHNACPATDVMPDYVNRALSKRFIEKYREILLGLFDRLPEQKNISNSDFNKMVAFHEEFLRDSIDEVFNMNVLSPQEKRDVSRPQLRTWFLEAPQYAELCREDDTELNFPSFEPLWEQAAAEFSQDTFPTEALSEFCTKFLLVLKSTTEKVTDDIKYHTGSRCRDTLQFFVSRIASADPASWQDVRDIREQGKEFFHIMHHEASPEVEGYCKTDLLEIFPSIGDRRLCGEIVKLLESVVSNLETETGDQLAFLKNKQRVADFKGMIEKQFSFSQNNEEVSEELPSMTKAEVSVLLDGIMTGLIEHERQQNPGMDDVDIEYAVGALRPQMGLLIKRCPEILTRDHDDFLRSLVSMALQISVETTEAGLTEKQWQTLTQSQKLMPLKHQYLLEISDILKREAQNACRIIQEKLKIPTISCQELLDVLASAQGSTDIINDDLPATLESIRKHHPQSFKKLSELGDRLRGLSERITTNLPMRIDKHVANRYIIFCLTLRGFFIQELGQVNRSAGAALAQNNLEATTKAEAELQRLFPPSTKKKEKENPSFGLEGEGPFSRKVLSEAINRQEKKMRKDYHLDLNRTWSIFLRRKVLALCPEEITRVSDVSRIMHYLKGYSVSSRTETVFTNTLDLPQITRDYYGIIFEQIGRRFGVEGVGFDYNGLRKTYERSEHVISLQEVITIVLKFISEENVQILLRAKLRNNERIVPPRLQQKVIQYFVDIRKIVPEFLSECLPEGFAAVEEIELLHAFVNQGLSQLDIVFANDEQSLTRFQKRTLDVCWMPMRKELEDRLNPPSLKKIEEPTLMTNQVRQTLYAQAFEGLTLSNDDAQRLEDILVSEDGEACLALYEIFSQHQHALVKPVTAEWTIDESLDSLDKARSSFNVFTVALTGLNSDLGSRIQKLYQDAFTRFELSVHEYFVSSSYPK